MRSKRSVNMRVEFSIVDVFLQSRNLTKLRKRNEHGRIASPEIQLHTLRKQVPAGTGIRLVHVHRNIKRVADFGVCDAVDKYWEGVEFAPVGEFAACGDIQRFADFGDVWQVDPACFVGDGLEVKGLAGFCWVGGARVLLYGLAHQDVIEGQGGSGHCGSGDWR